MSQCFFSLIVLSICLLGVCQANICEQKVYKSALQQPCAAQMIVTAPVSFSISFDSNYGEFTAHCERQRAPVWVDRIYNLVLNGYYNNNYFFRVLDGFVAQFGTNGDPSVSNIYNFNSPDLGICGILEPQPPYMPINEGETTGLSNVFGTLSMSTSYNETTETTWNATAELFINLGNNSNLDKMLFVPVCTIDPADMLRVVLKFPSFGEVQELGGPGPSIDALYAEGNAYIEMNPTWDTMGLTAAVSVSCAATTASTTDHSCGPCGVTNSTALSALTSVPYSSFSAMDGWVCPAGWPVDSCAV